MTQLLLDFSETLKDADGGMYERFLGIERNETLGK